MESLVIRLNNVADSYYGFVTAVMTYVNNKVSRLDKVEMYLNDNPNALSADILDFISNQEDFYEDAAYANERSACTDVS